MVEDDEIFNQLIIGLGMAEACPSTILLMRVAFLRGKGQSVDVSAVRKSLAAVDEGTRTLPGRKHRCKCSGNATNNG